MNQIKNRFTGKVIYEDRKSIKELTIKNMANLSRADLSEANLSGADLSEANLSRADLSEANLSGADLSEANLSRANLYGANLSRADLYEANLSRANLYGANLSRADLYEANLSRADLSEANLSRADLSEANLSGADLSMTDLSGANLDFRLFPSIRLLSSINLGIISDNLTLELMRRDAYAHPRPEEFDEWEKGADCPYKNEERFWLFNERKGIWKKGKPKMTDRDLILAICKEKKWKIRGYYDK